MTKFQFILGFGLATFSFCDQMRLFFTTDSSLFDSRADLKWFLNQIEFEILSIARSVGMDLNHQEWNRDSSPFFKNHNNYVPSRRLSLRDPSA